MIKIFKHMLEKIEKQEYYEFIRSFRQKILNEERKIVFLCIGTPKVTGDSFGPKVGSFLNEHSRMDFEVLGDLKNPISEKKDIKKIYPKLKNKCVIVVDSAFASENLIGRIFITANSMKIGKALGFEKANLGDISVKAVVSKKQKNPILNLKSLMYIDKLYIEKLAKSVGSGIISAMSVC